MRQSSAFLNDDVELITRDWLERTGGARPVDGVGAVGAMLYYPTNSIQHAGVILGLGGVADLQFRQHAARHTGYYGRGVLEQDLSCVTAACMVMRREVFDRIGGLQRAIMQSPSTTSTCASAFGSSGLRIIWTPTVEMYHHESASLGGTMRRIGTNFFGTKSEQCARSGAGSWIPTRSSIPTSPLQRLTTRWHFHRGFLSSRNWDVTGPRWPRRVSFENAGVMIKRSGMQHGHYGLKSCGRSRGCTLTITARTEGGSIRAVRSPCQAALSRKLFGQPVLGIGVTRWPRLQISSTVEGTFEWADFLHLPGFVLCPWRSFARARGRRCVLFTQIPACELCSRPITRCAPTGINSK